MVNYIPHTISIRTVHQTNNHYCGPACAKMILDFIGAENFTQRQLYKIIHEYKTIDPRKKWKWASSPDGLKNVLNEYRPPAFENEFEIRKSVNQITIAKRMADVLSKDRVPCIALVHGDRHWLVVNGYDSILPSPGKPEPKSPDIGGLYIRDPLKSDTQRHVDYNIWTDKFCNMPVRTGAWDNEFIAICDPFPSGKKKGQKKLSVTFKSDLKKFYGKTPEGQNTSNSNSKIPDTTKIDPAPSAEPVKSFGPILINGKKIIDEATVKNYSLWWMKERGFNELKMEDMIKINPFPTKPLLIQYFGTKDYYFLVPMKENDNKISVIMFVNATNANYQETIFATNKPMVFKPLTQNKILNLLIDNNEISKKDKKINIEPILTWKACNESLFPEQPFYVVKIGTRKRYVRLDGKIFPRLTKITTAL